MKKILAVLTIFVISFVGVTFAGAEQMDLSSYSLDELVALRNSITEEISVRLGDAGTIDQGLYEVGVDIKASSFEVMGLEGAEDYARVIIFDNREQLDATKALQTHNIGEGQSAIINLKEGQWLRINNYGPISIQEVKPSYAP